MNQEIQRHITGIYSKLDDFDNTKDLLEIRYWLLSSNLGQNDNFLMARFNIEKQRELVTRHLTRLSESVDNLEIRVNQCTHLILLEKKKDPKFAKAYDKYHKKLKGNIQGVSLDN
jgi:hypothetical protein